MDSAFEWYVGQSLMDINRNLAGLIGACLTYPTLSQDRQTEYKITVIDYKLTVIIRDIESRLRTVHQITEQSTIRRLQP